MALTSKWLFLASGGYVVLCIPAILLAERFDWPEAPLHATQLLATLICLVSSIRFVWITRGKGLGWERSLAFTASVLTGLWLAFVCFVLLTFTLGGID